MVIEKTMVFLTRRKEKKNVIMAIMALGLKNRLQNSYVKNDR